MPLTYRQIKGSALTIEEGDANIEYLDNKIDTKADDADVVHNTGNETVAGIKTLSNKLVITDATASTAYTNGSLVVDGGVGIAGDTFSNGNFYSNGIAGTPFTWGISGARAGTNLAGSPLILYAGLGTGTGTASYFSFYTSTPTTTGTTTQAAAARVRIGAYGVGISASLDTSSAPNESLVNDAGVLKWKDSGGVLRSLY